MVVSFPNVAQLFRSVNGAVLLNSAYEGAERHLGGGDDFAVWSARSSIGLVR